ncbi:transporter [Lithospermum erythrorhizon]|uniref:Transporter n=1 Tax=Lithospermum erythrorhizon TaxID=34254 RepID=A0AAV3R964_LITER
MTRVLVATIKKRRSKLLDRSCNIQQVEEVKCVIKLIPIWVACIIYFIAQVQMGTSSIAQALQTDRRVSQNSDFKIPAATYSVFSLLALTIWIPIYDQIIIPKARKITKTEDGISMLQRLGVGFFLAIITMIISGLVENKRRAIAISQPTLGFAKSGGKISAMSCYWLVPQYAIVGISEGFSIIGQLEFYNKQLPENMRT